MSDFVPDGPIENVPRSVKSGAYAGRGIAVFTSGGDSQGILPDYIFLVYGVSD